MDAGISKIAQNVGVDSGIGGVLGFSSVWEAIMVLMGNEEKNGPSLDVLRSMVETASAEASSAYYLARDDKNQKKWQDDAFKQDLNDDMRALAASFNGIIIHHVIPGMARGDALFHLILK